MILAHDLPVVSATITAREPATAEHLAQVFSAQLAGKVFRGFCRMEVGGEVALVMQFVEQGRLACCLVLRGPWYRFDYRGTKPQSDSIASIYLEPGSRVVRALGTQREGAPCIDMLFDSGDSLVCWGHVSLLVPE